MKAINAISVLNDQIEWLQDEAEIWGPPDSEQLCAKANAIGRVIAVLEAAQKAFEAWLCHGDEGAWDTQGVLDDAMRAQGAALAALAALDENGEGETDDGSASKDR